MQIYIKLNTTILVEMETALSSKLNGLKIYPLFTSLQNHKSKNGEVLQINEDNEPLVEVRLCYRYSSW